MKYLQKKSYQFLFEKFKIVLNFDLIILIKKINITIFVIYKINKKIKLNISFIFILLYADRRRDRYKFFSNNRYR